MWWSKQGESSIPPPSNLVTSLKINRLLPMTTINMHMKFEIEIPKQTWLTSRKPCHLQSPETEKSNMAARRPFWKWRFWKWPPWTCIWSLKLKFQSKLDLHPGNLVTYRVQKPKNLIWLPGGHFENDVSENDHHEHAYEVWNWNSKANLTYIPETLSPTESRNRKI